LEDGVYRTGSDARIAINAVFWIDKHHSFSLAKAVRRANGHAMCMLAVTAWFSDHMSHRCYPKKSFGTEKRFFFGSVVQ
jgi:hypothetical protein